MEFILVGQPNSGKSTVYNRVIGYKSETGNFPGVTMTYTRGSTYVNGNRVDVVDIPGTYSLQTTDDAELMAVKYLMNAPEDTVIVNVVDASVLSRSLELTLQLMELKRPMVVALNMMDEAERKGIQIDSQLLSERIGVPVVKMVGKKGEGVYDLFRAALKASQSKILPKTVELTFEAAKVVGDVRKYLVAKKVPTKWDLTFISLKILEKDKLIKTYLDRYFKNSEWRYIDKVLKKFESVHRRNSELVVSSIRHNLAFKIFEEVSRVGSPVKKDFRLALDKWLMHPLFGYFFMGLALYLTFTFVFSIGGSIEPLITGVYERFTAVLAVKLGENTFLFAILDGFIQGLGGGLAIVVSYLLPFFVVFSVLEDTGYLARIAYLIDNVMHLIGLHGTSVVPLVLGYGCTVPGIMATRILKTKRDKLITATLTTMIPCSARMIIIVGVAGSLSMGAAALVYFLNIVVLGLTGKMMSKAMPEISPGLLLEIPKYHLPTMDDIFKKTWFRMKEFVVIAWPLLIVGSVILEAIGYFKLINLVNTLMAPFTVSVLGLPAVVGVVFLFGILRKELALILLITALGTKEIQLVLTPVQILTFTVFSTFYIPCLATFAATAKELGYRNAFLVAGISMGNAVALSLAIRLAFAMFG